MTAKLSPEQYNSRLKTLPLAVQKRIAAWDVIGKDLSLANESASAAHWETITRLREKLGESQVRLNGYARDAERYGVRSGTMRTGAHGVEITPDATTPEGEERVRNAELRDQLNRLTKRGPGVPSFPPTPSLVGLRDMLASGSKYEEFAPSVTLKKGQSAEQALSATREVIERLASELKGIDRLPLAESDALAQALSDIDKASLGGAVDFSRCFRLVEWSADPDTPRRQGRVAFPLTYTRGDGPDGVIESENAFAFSVWLHREALIARAKQEISKLAQPDRAMALADRPIRKAELANRILELERTEQVLLDMALADGANVKWRHAPSTEAVLKIRRAD